MFTDFMGDFRFGARKLRRSPGFTVIAVTMLALGIGANSAVFSFIDALLLKTLPVAEPDRLIVLGPGGRGVVGRSDSPQVDHFSYAQLEAIAERKDVFTRVAAAPTFMSGLTVGERDTNGNAQQVTGQLVSGEYFEMAGIQPFAGRWIAPEDARLQGEAHVVVVSQQYWERRLDADPDALGRTLVLQDEAFQVIGIAPDFFRGHVLEQPVDMWIPLSAQPIITRRDSMLEGQNRTMDYWLEILGRLAPGVTIEQAEEAVNVEIRRVHETAGGGELENYQLSLTPAGRGLSSLRSSLGFPLKLLYGGTGLLLLIVCANLANLLLARASDRRGEIGVRLALGAGRGRLVRQLLAESFLLAAAGSALGIALAAWLVPVIGGMVARMRGPNLLAVQLDHRVLAATSIVGVSTVVLFGLAPALWSLRHGRGVGLAGPRGSAAGARNHALTKNALVAGQAALSLVLLSCTGLLFKTLGELKSVNLGMEIRDVHYFQMNPQSAGMPVETQEAMREAVIAEVTAVPGVEAAAFTSSPPLSGNFSTSTTEIPGYEPGPDENMNVLYDRVSPTYFDTFKIPLVAGRSFERTDRVDEAVVVTEAFADRFFPKGGAVGATIRNRDQELRVVGVVGDVRQVNLRDAPPPVVYQPTTGYRGYLRTLLFQTGRDLSVVGPEVYEAIRRAAPQVPVNRTPARTTLFVERSTTVERLLSQLTAAFAGLALLLAALGVYGLFSYSVRQRSGEFGVRQALGADRGDVVRLVMRQAGVVLAAGAAAGLVASLFAGRLLSGILYGVGDRDPASLSLAFVVLLTAGLLAAYGPARRAAAVNPADLLRQE